MKIDGFKIVIIGSGGRENAIAWKISTSSKSEKIYCLPGNPGTAQLKKCENIEINVNSYEKIIEFCKNFEIDLVVIGPEIHLANGLADRLIKENISVFGPSKLASQLESSKFFTKEICKKYNIPTADYKEFRTFQDAAEYIKTATFPIVLKQDGLAAGKGVVIAPNINDALSNLEEMFKKDSLIVIEEFLEGVEMSFFAFISGNEILPFTSAQDYKKAYDGDKGPNTGGMGSYSPSKYLNSDLEQEIIEKIINPTVKALKDKNIIYRGVLFAGLMLTKDGPKLIEYNVRFGDPETQVMLMRLESDIIDIFYACINGSLNEIEIKFSEYTAVCLVMAANGYPGKYIENSIVILPKYIPENCILFHAGTKYENDQLISNGGRVLNICAKGRNINEAREIVYNFAENIEWEDGFYRKDIAK